MKRLLLGLAAAGALWSASCSGGGATIQPPPPAGKFSSASLSGTYAFMTTGEVCAGCTVAATPLQRVGSFIADGKGGITGGVYDVVTLGGATGSAISIVSGSSYTVNADGRGTLTFNVTSNGAPTSLKFGIVLTSTSDGLMIDETSNATQASTGSGNFVLQSSAALQAGVSSISGPFVFDFSGFDGNANGPFPESLVGQFAAANGVITSGFEDANDGFGLSNGSIAGSLTADPVNMPTSGRGTAVIAGQNYTFYIVDSTRVRFISTNTVNGSGPMLNGDAVQQQANIPQILSAINGGYVFVVGGSDSGGNGLTRVGRFTATGSPLSKMLMDVNDGSNEGQFNSLSNGSISSYDATTGRGQFSFQDSGGAVYTFVFYLSSQNGGVIQEVSGATGTGTAVVVDDGSIALQSGSPFTGSNISGTYGMNWSGLVTANGNISSTDEEDLLGQLSISNLTLSGTSDAFQFTSPTLTPNVNVGTAGSINFNSGDGASDDGKRVDMNVSLSGSAPIDMVVYIVNPQLAFFANRDNSGTERIVSGILKVQQ